MVGGEKVHWSWKDSWRDNVVRSRFTSFIRIGFATAFLIFYWVTGYSDFVILQSVQWAFTAVFMILLWLPAFIPVGSKVAEITAGRIPGYLRTLSDVLQIALCAHVTGGFDSPMLAGLAVPIVLSSFGNSPWRGKSAAIVGTCLAVLSELSASNGWTPDVNLLGHAASPSSLIQIILIGAGIFIGLFTLAVVANRLYTTALQARMEAARLLEEANAAKAESEKARAETERLAQFSRTINESTDLNAILDQIFGFLMSEFGGRDVVMQLVDQEKNELFAVKCTSNRSAADVDYVMALRIPLEEKSGTLFQTFVRQKPFYVPQIRRFKSEVDRLIVGTFQLESLAQFPLVIQRKTIGILWLSFRGGMRRKRSEIQAIARFCDQVAGAVHNARILKNASEAREQAERNALQLSELTESAREVNASTDLDKILTRVFDRIQANCNVDYFGMYLVDQEKQELYGSHHRHADAGQEEEEAFYRQRLSLNTRSLMMLSLRRGRPAYIPDLTHFRLAAPEQALTQSLKLKSMMFVPLRVGEELVGVINFSLYNRPMNLTPDQVNFVSAFGQQIAGAVKNAMLLKETELARAQAESARAESDRGRRTVEKLNEFSKALNASTDFQSTIRQIVAYLQSEYSIDSSTLLLPDPGSGELRPALAISHDSVDPNVIRSVEALSVPFGPEGGMIRLAYDRRKPLYIRANGKRNIFSRPYPGMDRDRALIAAIRLQWFLLLPLVVQERSIGILLVTSYARPQGLDSHEIREVERFSDQVAGAVHTSNLLNQIKHERDRAENARAEVEASRAETELLADLARKANEGHNLDEIVWAAKEVAGRKLGADTAALWLVDSVKQRLLLRSHAIPDVNPERLAEIREIPLQPESGILYRTYTRGRIFALDRIDPEWLSGSPIDNSVVRAINLQWFVHAPLKLDGKVIGILAMTGPKAKRLRKHETQFIEKIAAQIAGAVRAQELLRLAEDGRREIATMAEFTRRVNESSDLNLIIGDITRYVVETMKLAGASLSLVNEARTELYNAGGFRLNTTPEQNQFARELRVPLTPQSGSLFETYQGKHTLYLRDFSESTSEIDQSIVRTFGVKSAVQMPLKIGDEVLGILTLDPGETKLSDEDIQKLETFVDQIAGAVQNARLLQASKAARAESDKAREETTTLADIARRVNEGHNIQEILGPMFEILERRFSADSLALYTFDPVANAMVMRSGIRAGQPAVVSGFRDAVRVIPMTPDGGTMFRTYTRKKIFYVNRIDPTWLASSPVDGAVVQSFGSSWFVQVPLMVDGRVIGIFPFTGRVGHRISKEDLQFVERMATQIAGAVRAMDLVRETDAARADSDRLLYNILPRRVAEELKREGRVEPLFYDSVTVLFTDFVGFTQASANMLPDELIEQLDGCFSQFDEVVKRNNMEKLKTIGDAYMCAAGLPALSPTHAIDACLTALEFRSFMVQMASIKESLGHPFWRLRIGVHSGPVTAGVVGSNKFAYDIWGDTVNTASRMESSGQADKVNISGDTHELVRDFFDCEYRGKVMAKGKGEIDMYFLLRIKPDLSADAEGLLPNGKFEVMRMSLVPQL